jgi:hypothetical protein
MTTTCSKERREGRRKDHRSFRSDNKAKGVKKEDTFLWDVQEKRKEEHTSFPLA